MEKQKPIVLFSFIEEKCKECQKYKKRFNKDKNIIWVNKEEFNNFYKKEDIKNSEKELRKKLDVCPNLFHKETGFLFIGKTPGIARSFIRGYLNPKELEKNVGKIINNFIGEKNNPIMINTK